MSLVVPLILCLSLTAGVAQTRPDFSGLLPKMGQVAQFRGAGILALVAMTLRAMSPIPVQFDPTTATWRVRTTNHFDIYYAQARDLDSIAREAERAYARVSRDLRRQVPGKVPLILLPTSRDLPQTAQEAAVIVRASGAPDRDHLLLPVEPRNGRENLLAHELTHVFEFESTITPPNARRRLLP